MQLKDASLFRQQAYIDGNWLDADSGQTIKVNNPATNEIIGTVPKMGAAETRRAIEAADRALPAWRSLTAKERATKLRRWFDLLMENQDDLGRLMTMEQGKPLAEAKGEIAYAASFIEWFAEEGKRVYGDTIPGHQADKRILVMKQPIGVTAAITPWNFPAAMITRKAGPALAAGCTMVIKPASQTPFSALALMVLAERAGIPKGRGQRGNRQRRRYRQRADRQPAGAQAVLHRFDRNRSSADDGMRQGHQEGFAGAGRQRAVHRVRRCRSGCRGRWRAGVQVPQRRPDLRVCQPPVCAGRCV
jgi:hypothetical protein